MNVYNYNHLYYFYVTAKLEGITLAAKHLNTSQSSLSTQIKTLEYSLKKSLFRKTGRKIELTDDGKELYRYVRQAFEVFEEMFDQLNKKPNSMGARITVGVSKEIDRPFVTDILSKTIKQYQKNLRPLINLLSLESDELYHQLQTGQIDLLLTTNALVGGKIQVIKEFQIAVGAFASRDLADQLSGETIETIFKNESVGFVLPSKITRLRGEIDNYLLKRKIRPTVVFESNVVASIVRAATDGLGMVILPDAYVARELKSEKLFQLSNKPLWKHSLLAIKLKDGSSAAKQNFSDVFVKEFEVAIESALNRKRAK